MPGPFQLAIVAVMVLGIALIFVAVVKILRK